MDFRDRLLTVLESMLNAGPEPDQMLDAALRELVEATEAERGFIILVDAASTPRFVSSHHIDPALLEAENIRISFGIVEQVLAARQARRVANTHMDEVLRDRQSVQSMAARSVLCVPIVTEERTVGVIYLDTPANRKTFGEGELQLLTAFAGRAQKHFAAAVDYWELRQRVLALAEQLKETKREIQHGLGTMVGKSPAMRKVFSMIERVAQVDFPVLIVGETGTGKELAAREIHQTSPRRDGPFIAVNCAEFNETLLESELFGHVKGAFTGAAADKKGLLEVASGGTLFLDEVENMSNAMQAKLLRVLEDQQVRPVGARAPVNVDVRVISATNQDLEEMIAEGEFREDLFHRLNVIHIDLPPLRQRLEDLPLLVEHLLKRICAEMRRTPPNVDESAMRALAKYPWPGNVRELTNELKRAALTCADVLGMDDLSPKILKPEGTADVGLEAEVGGLEKKRIADALVAAGWNVSSAARALNMDRKALARRMKKYGIIPPP